MEENGYYIVVSATRSPTSCVVWGVLAVIASLVTVAGGQSPQFAPSPQLAQSAQTAQTAQTAALPLFPVIDAWETQLPATPAADAALDAARIYIPVRGGDLIALERTTGEVAWSRPLATEMAPAADGDRVYVAGTGAVHALDPATGAERWQARIAVAGPGMLLRGPLVLASATAGGLVAVRRDNGAAAWSAPLDGTAVTAMTADDDAVYAATSDGRLVAIGLADGDVRWSQALDGTPAAPALAPGRVFVGTDANTFYAFDPRTGRRYWRWALGGSFIGAAATEDRVHVVALDNLLRAFNRGNGHQRWRQALATRPVAPPRIIGEEILVAGVDPVLSSFRLANGLPLGSYAAPGLALAQGMPLIDPQVDAGAVHIVIVLRDGRVVGLRREG